MKSKKSIFILSFFVITLLTISGNVFAKERRGADLEIEKKDGQQIKGELIMVKNTSLLLLDSGSGADVSIDIKDLGWITIKQKPQFWKGASIGMLVGGISGALVGLSSGYEMSPMDLSDEGYALFWGAGGLVIGGLIGGVITASKKDETIEIDENLFKEAPQNKRSNDKFIDTELGKIINKLRKKARVPYYK